MERIGIIDLGSNSVRLVIIDIDSKGAHHPIENLKETVRLISNTDTHGTITKDAIDYAVSTIRLFSGFCRERKVEQVLAVATAAVRQAPNGPEIIDRLHQETGIKVRLLTGDEEAHLCYLGMINTMPSSYGLMADLGGGSLKLVNFEGRIQKETVCLEFGAVSLAETFDIKSLPKEGELQRLEQFLADSFADLPWLVGKGPVIGLGGTFRSLARIVRRKTGYLPDITDNMEIPANTIKELYQQVAGMSLKQRLLIPGLERSRADISIAGLGVINALMQVTNSSRLNVGTSGLRDGLLYEYLSRTTNDPIVLSVLTESIDNLIRYNNLEEIHVRRIANAALTLFDSLAELHTMGTYERRILLVACLLHELGVVISVEGRDKHTLYMILHAPLHGLSHRERVIAAFTAASHDRLYLSNVEQYVQSGPLTEEDVDLIGKLAVLLQISHSLDRCHTGVITQVQASIDDDTCTLEVAARTKAELEIKDAMRKAESFEQVFRRKLEIIHRK